MISFLLTCVVAILILALLNYLMIYLKLDAGVRMILLITLAILVIIKFLS